ncbi:MAG: DNA polymerase IV [Sphaerochaetaceae bacterium]
MSHIWFHVDLDAFYASVEQLDNPEYRNKPVIVGGKSNRSVVSACSYEARAYGVHSAMPVYLAKTKCPHGIYVRPRMERYSEKSREVMKELAAFSPYVQQISVDEAFLDMSGTERLFGKPKEAALLLKKRIKENTGLTLSVGIATSRFIAKLASGYQKPDGLSLISPGREQDFVDAVGLKKLWGVGKKTLEQLHKHNITTPKELRTYSKEHLQRLFGEAAGSFLYSTSRGIDPGMYAEESKSRSISTEMTFVVDVCESISIDQALLAMAHDVMFRLFEEQLFSTTVAVKIRYSDFSTYSVQTTTTDSIVSADQVYNLAKDLFYSKWRKGEPIRLLGVGLYNVKEHSSHIQQSLFDDEYARKHTLEKTILKLKSEGLTLKKASLLEPKEQDESPLKK